MKFTYQKKWGKALKSDALAVPFFQCKGEASLAHPLPQEGSQVCNSFLSLPDFQGKEGEIALFYRPESSIPRLFFVGLGPQVLPGSLHGREEAAFLEALRMGYAALVRQALAKKCKQLAIAIPTEFPVSRDVALFAITEGVLLSNYRYVGHKKPVDPAEQALLEEVLWIGVDPKERVLFEKALSVCRAVHYARDLVNGSSDEVTPQHLAEEAKRIAREYPAIEVRVFNKAQIEKEGMGLLLAVNRGSSLDPVFLVATYKGVSRSKEHTVLVGKGITFDTGGLHVKSFGGMETMRCDMAGAAACLGALRAVADLGAPVHLSVVIPATENAIDATSMKPGDVFISHSGKSVEVINTDAEGRLVLADALSYVCRQMQPTQVIDIATLTGAIEIALGPEAAGLMSSDAGLAEGLVAAGELVGERLWQMPIFKGHRQRLRSDIADLKNWNGRPGGACMAAAFLQEFMDPKIPWAHIDIAATAFLSEADEYRPKYGTGTGVRLLVEYVLRRKGGSAS